MGSKQQVGARYAHTQIEGDNKIFIQALQKKSRYHERYKCLLKILPFIYNHVLRLVLLVAMRTEGNATYICISLDPTDPQWKMLRVRRLEYHMYLQKVTAQQIGQHGLVSISSPQLCEMQYLKEFTPMLYGDIIDRILER